jgi:hypothetical protein
MQKYGNAQWRCSTEYDTVTAKLGLTSQQWQFTARGMPMHPAPRQPPWICRDHSQQPCSGDACDVCNRIQSSRYNVWNCAARVW